MTEGTANDPVCRSTYAQLEAVSLTPLERERAKRYLEQSERLVDLLFASAAGLKRLFDVAIVNPVRSCVAVVARIVPGAGRVTRRRAHCLGSGTGESRGLRCFAPHC